MLINKVALVANLVGLLVALWLGQGSWAVVNMGFMLLNAMCLRDR